jgi:hypothetical protein
MASGKHNQVMTGRGSNSPVGAIKASRRDQSNNQSINPSINQSVATQLKSGHQSNQITIRSEAPEATRGFFTWAVRDPQ